MKKNSNHSDDSGNLPKRVSFRFSLLLSFIFIVTYLIVSLILTMDVATINLLNINKLPQHLILLVIVVRKLAFLQMIRLHIFIISLFALSFIIKRKDLFVVLFSSSFALIISITSHFVKEEISNQAGVITQQSNIYPVSSISYICQGLLEVVTILSVAWILDLLTLGIHITIHKNHK